jgi:hypothetical protein
VPKPKWTSPWKIRFPLSMSASLVAISGLHLAKGKGDRWDWGTIAVGSLLVATLMIVEKRMRDGRPVG